jgi:hypothetical protein
VAIFRTDGAQGSRRWASTPTLHWSWRSWRLGGSFVSVADAQEIFAGREKMSGLWHREDKSEIRNPKSETNPKSKIQNQK